MDKEGKLVDGATLQFDRHFAADVETVWSYLVDPAKREKWFCGGSTGSAVGEEIVFDFDHRRLSSKPAPEKYKDEATARFAGEILEYDPPNRLAFTWPDEYGEGTKVEITLSEAEDGGTHLRLIHSQLGNRDYRIGALAGWHAHFDLLDDLLAGQPTREFWDTHVSLEQHYGAKIP